MLKAKKETAMLLEMHCHSSEHSGCSGVTALTLVRQACAKGLQGIVLTDHQYLWPSQALKSLRREAAVPDHFLILSGQEVLTKELGDVLVYGAQESFAKGSSLSDIRSRAPEAALVWAHPYRKGKRPEAAQLLNPLLDGVEIFNSNHLPSENSRGLSDWHRHRFTALAGSDAHSRSIIGVFPSLFDHPVQSVAELAREIRAGRCRPFLKEIPRAGTHSRVTEVTFGIKGPDEKRERIIIRAHTDAKRFRSASRASMILEALGDSGLFEGRFRVPRILDRDEEHLTFIESGLRGKTLHEKLLQASGEDRRLYLGLCARWLARLHDSRLRLTEAGEFLATEPKRIARYLQRFTDIAHPHSLRAQEIAGAVLEQEERLCREHPELLIQGHGDFHPKNVLIGQDLSGDASTLFCAAVDFESSLCLPPAFDLGYFLAQYRHQFDEYPEVLSDAPESCFIEAYLQARTEAEPDLLRQLELFRARTNLGIAAFLIKLGLGQSEALWRLLAEASGCLACYAAGSRRF